MGVKRYMDQLYASPRGRAALISIVEVRKRHQEARDARKKAHRALVHAAHDLRKASWTPIMTGLVLNISVKRVQALWKEPRS